MSMQLMMNKAKAAFGSQKKAVGVGVEVGVLSGQRSGNSGVRISLKDKDYGMDYCPPVDVEVSSTASTTSVEYELDLQAGVFQPATQEVPEPEPEEDPEMLFRQSHIHLGECEALYQYKKKSLPVLIAMIQGLRYEEGVDMRIGWMFDLDEDEFLKSMPQRNLVLPKGNHLKDEAARRAQILELKPLRKSASKSQMIEWLRMNPIENGIDVEWLKRKAKSLYVSFKVLSEEAAANQRESLINKNWIMENNLRLYLACMSDEARLLMTTKDDCLNRSELDGRNSLERPKTWYEKTAEVYNSDEIFYTECLPDLHETFAEPMALNLEDMPGGPITADTVKVRLSDARARLIILISRWERSGNGFGLQREEDDAEFGHVDAEDTFVDGDDRSRFIRPDLGLKVHHLYLWHLSDKMGVLKNVLNVLSKEVAVDGDNIPSGLSQTQKKRKSPPVASVQDEESEQSKKHFRDGVLTSLKTLGDGLVQANSIQIVANCDTKIVSLREAIGKLDDRIERMTWQYLELTEDSQIKLMKKLLDKHHARSKLLCAEYDEQMTKRSAMEEAAPGFTTP
jgi:hypothetical protein